MIELWAFAASFHRFFLRVGALVHIEQEHQNKEDKYHRKLCCAYLKGSCINKLLVTEGYAKPYNNIDCNELPKYQRLNIFAKQNSKGLCSLVENF